MLRRAVAPEGRQKLYYKHLAFSADRTGGDIDAADPDQLFLPRLWYISLLRYRLTAAQQLAADRDSGFAVSVSQKPEVADPDIA